MDTPTTIGRYRITGLLGEGGMGRVFLAHDPTIGRPVAIKVVAGPFDRRRFLLEARAAGRVRHPAIVTVYDVSEADGQAFIAMEYVVGQTLEALISRTSVETLAFRLSLMEQLCDGLAAAHEAGVIHLDIKPSNLMLDERGQLRILDFGIARAVDTNTTAQVLFAGSSGYMPPEQAQGHLTDRRADVYATCVVAYELMTGRRVLPEGIRSLADVVPFIGYDLDLTIRKGVDHDPRRRFPSTKELGRAFTRHRLALEKARGTVEPVSVESPPMFGVDQRSTTVLQEGTTLFSSSGEPEDRTSSWRKRVAFAGAGLAIALLLWAKPWSSSDGTSTPNATSENTRTKNLEIGNTSGPPGVSASPTPVQSPGLSSGGGRSRQAKSPSMPLGARPSAGPSVTPITIGRPVMPSAVGELVVTVRSGDKLLRDALIGLYPDRGPVLGGITGSDGVAHIKEVPPGQFRVEAKLEGYATQERQAVQVIAGEQRSLEIQLTLMGPRVESPPAPPPAVRGVDNDLDRKAVIATLDRYSHTLASLSTIDLRGSYPSINDAELRAFAATFTDALQYTFRCENQQVNIAGDTATILCRITREYVTRAGERKSQTGMGTISFTRQAERWVISGMSR